MPGSAVIDSMLKSLGWGEEDSHMKVTGMLVEKLELNPEGDQSGRCSGVI